MTAVDGYTQAVTGDRTLPTLGALVDALGCGQIRVCTAPAALLVPVGEPVVYDPLQDGGVGCDDVVLAAGVDPDKRSAIDMITRCAELGACAVLLRTDCAPPPGLVAAAEAAGIALLAAPRDATWGQLHTLLLTAWSASSQTHLHDAAPLGDLFAVADVVSSRVGGAVTIEDGHSVVLAYSSNEHPVDAMRRNTILGRRVPTDLLDHLHESGVLRALVTSHDVVRVELEGLATRLAVAVRAGEELLGSIWVQEGDKSLGPAAEQALRQAASMAALHLLRARTGEELERRDSGDQLRAALMGRLPVTLLAETLQVDISSPLVVFALRPDGGRDHEERVMVDRAVDLIALSCRAFRRRVAACAIDRTVYCVIPARTGQRDETWRLVADLAQQVSRSLHVRTASCASDEPLGLSRLAATHTELDLALRVLLGSGATTHVHLDDVRASIVLLRLRDAALERPALLAGPVQELQRRDRERGTAYILTLRTFLDCFGDVRGASAKLNVHPNTLRYRLHRICEALSLDMDDPVERLVLHLQLHLLAP